ncbi:MAG: hypothetical protein NTX50_10230 [Candidatus Sumerlaeota bacterium]|nr:hypothetical protein [Candidatus Sumerlaeota bacterium]
MSIRKLLVEGLDDKRIIPHLVEPHGIRWESAPKQYVVEIIPCEGDSQILAPGLIETHWSEREMKALGIILDADENAADRWLQVRNRCQEMFPNLPVNISPQGLVINKNDQKFGVWIMPDNQSRGMMETFLSCLIPDNGHPLWSEAQSACQRAKELGAPYKEAHQDKAKIHCWLSWQDPPGRQMHEAIIEKILDPKSPQSAVFIQWFRSLYDL